MNSQWCFKRLPVKELRGPPEFRTEYSRKHIAPQTLHPARMLGQQSYREGRMGLVTAFPRAGGDS